MQSRWIIDGDRSKKWVKILAPAKINLFLKVIRRLPSGYHEIQSLMVPITLVDEISLFAALPLKGDKIKIACDDPSVPTHQENLAYKALRVLNEAGYPTGNVSIHIKKRIPAGAGLGGGSSDAAAVFKGIDYLYRLELSLDILRALGLKIGADIPFFFMEKACMVSGIGEVLNPVEISCKIWLVIGFPGFSIPTQKVYQALDLELTNPDTQVNMPISLEGGNLQKGETWHLVNELESPIFVWYPFLGDVCRKLREFGALEARMTGSGSSIFGIFKERTAAATAMSKLWKQLPEWKFFLARPVWQGIDDSWRNANGSD